ncbi:hypothetical protein HBI48_038880 [Parastagonospora nodorum]|nr:hypothetical protein HBI48_038880 [Parastagonospora nodorum]
MSAPSSDGRPSTSSEPSATSSRTLHSRGSGAYTEHGEGSTHRQRYASGYDTGTVNGANGTQSRSQNGLLSTESVDDQDFARRRQRVRRSGGFLLESSFPTSPRKHQARADDKGKRSSRHLDVSRVDGQQDGRRRRRHSPDSSPVTRDRESAASEATYNGSVETRMQHGDELHVGRTRNDARNMQDGNQRPTTPQAPAIDPNQLVHMALNLSESRRRNINAGPLLAAQPRTASGGQREGSFSNQGAGGSLRQYLNEQRRMSRNMSPMGGQGSPSRHMSTSMQRSGSMAFPSSQSFNPSPATIARRDKARNYIELRIEYLRLLEHLPPLKLDANAPGNFIVTANNMPGSPQAQLTRVPSYAGKQYDLGRPYNPLQYIRNRRSRARERRSLNHAPHEFADIHEVRDWVDTVERTAARPGYRRDDGVSLPKIHDDHPESLESRKPPKPHKGWIFAPEELLADAYWLEQGDNKTIIENRHGRKIYPPRETPKPDLLQPRASKEYSDKRRRSWIEGVTGGDPPSGGESEKGSERGRKRRLLPAFRSDSPKHGRHSRHGSRLRANIDSDSSDSDSDSGTRRPRIVIDEDHNTGPLALQLETRLKQQANQAHEKSPNIVSPDTPDKWGRYHPGVSAEKVSRDSLEVPRIGNGFSSMDHPGHFRMPPRVRTNATLTIDDDIEPRSSFDDQDSTAPNTPLHQKRFPRLSGHYSPPPSRDSSVTRKSKRNKFNPFHSHENSGEHEDDHNDTESAEMDKKGRSRQTSDEKQDSGHVGHAIMAAPSAVKSLLMHRKNDSTSSLPSPEKLRRRDTQEPHSAVSRFFQGVKHEGSKVGGFVFRRDRPDDDDTDTMSDSQTAEYGTDTSVKGTKTHRLALSRSATATTIDAPTPKRDSRYHLDLPTFRPAHEAHMDGDGGFLPMDHISRQNRERQNSRSPRFDKLAPPRMDLGRLNTTTSQIVSEVSPKHGQDQMKKVLAHPSGVGHEDPFATSLRNARDTSDRNRSRSRPGLDGKRHWSIADDDGNILRRKTNAELVTQADIARVRALFLCSGVKAKEIDRRAHTKRSPPADFLVRAAKTADRELVPVARKEEHVLAARLLLRELESSTRSLSASTQQFRNKTIKELSERVTELRRKVDSDLMPRIFEGGDTAVRITSEISGQGPLQVKQITDDIDRMLRARPRRMRWLRGFGWMLVEWALVAVMWWLWLVVVLVGSVKRVFGFGWGVVRWLLWL